MQSDFTGIRMCALEPHDDPSRVKKTKIPQSIVCPNIVFQDARIVQAEVGNRLLTVNSCTANVLFGDSLFANLNLLAPNF